MESAQEKAALASFLNEKNKLQNRVAELEKELQFECKPCRSIVDPDCELCEGSGNQSHDYVADKLHKIISFFKAKTIVHGVRCVEC